MIRRSQPGNAGIRSLRSSDFTGRTYGNTFGEDVVFSSRIIDKKCLILVPKMSRALRRFCVAIATSGPCFVDLEM
jgi:hypothetical protein